MPKASFRDFERTSPDLDRTTQLLGEAQRYVSAASDTVENDHAISVANSSKAIEFTAKALLILAGYEYPLRHDVGPGLELVQRSLVAGGPGFELLPRAQRHIARVGLLCDLQGQVLQSAAEYGYAGKLASLILNETDARVFLEYGKECLDIGRWIADRVRDGTFKISQVELPKKGETGPKAPERDRAPSEYDQIRTKVELAQTVLKLAADGKPAASRIRIGTPHTAYLKPVEDLYPLISDTDRGLSRTDLEALLRISSSVKRLHDDKEALEALAKEFEETWPRVFEGIFQEYPRWKDRERELTLRSS